MPKADVGDFGQAARCLSCHPLLYDSVYRPAQFQASCTHLKQEIVACHRFAEEAQVRRFLGWTALWSGRVPLFVASLTRPAHSSSRHRRFLSQAGNILAELNVRVNLGHCLRLEGKSKEAVDYLADVYQIYEAHHFRDHLSRCATDLAEAALEYALLADCPAKEQVRCQKLILRASKSLKRDSQWADLSLSREVILPKLLSLDQKAAPSIIELTRPRDCSC